MDSGRLILDSSSSHGRHMLFLGGAKAMLSLEEGVNKRRPRPFFTTTEELLDEEYYDEQLLDKKRRLTPEQVHLLERSFEAENKLEPERKSELAKKLGLQPRQVAVWFQNRRARWKTKQLERDYDRLKTSYDALLADHEALLKDNDSLRSQVICLTEKLQERELLQATGKEPGSAIEGQLSPPSMAMLVTQQQTGGDRQSTGSAVVDGLIEGGAGSFLGHIGRGAASEEDAGTSDDGCSYLPGDILEDAAHADNWWAWN